jgi:hypothetical protein
MTLRIRRIATMGEIDQPLSEWRTYWYAVDGLPNGQSAELLQKGTFVWEVRRTVGSVMETWSERFSSANAALKALKQIVEAEAPK